MRIARIAAVLCIFVTAAASTGCFKAPLELKTALQRQANDLQQINVAYSQNVDALLTALEKLQLEYVKVAEDQVRSKYIYEGKIGEKATSTSNPDLLIIRVKSEKKITDYFSQKREQIHKNFLDKRKEFFKLQQSIDNAREVNSAMSDYVDSLIRLHKAQDTFGQTLLTRISNVVPVPKISSQVIDEVIRVTDQEVDTFFKDNTTEAAKEVKTGGQ